MTGISRTDTSRLAFPERPPGHPAIRQNWGKLLFIHWSIPTSLLRPLIPAPLVIDTYEGQAWIGVVPFTMWGIRLAFAPPIPGWSAFHELNVRTYVRFAGEPGVWFLSLDAANRLAVWAARKFYHLPYFKARMSLKQQEQTIHYYSKRAERQSVPAEFAAQWTIEEPLPQSVPGSLEFFLTERYCLYSEKLGQIFRARIFHRPWQLRRARLKSLASTMLTSHGLPEATSEPLLHYAEEIGVEIWSFGGNDIVSHKNHFPLDI